MDNYQFYLQANIRPYIGEWIAISRQEIVSHGKDVKAVFRKAKALHPRSRPLLVKVPGSEALIF